MGHPNYAHGLRERLTAAAYEPGASVAKLAQENDIHANMLFTGGDIRPSSKLSLPSSPRSYW